LNRLFRFYRYYTTIRKRLQGFLQIIFWSTKFLHPVPLPKFSQNDFLKRVREGLGARETVVDNERGVADFTGVSGAPLGLFHIFSHFLSFGQPQTKAQGLFGGSQVVFVQSPDEIIQVLAIDGAYLLGQDHRVLAQRASAAQNAMRWHGRQLDLARDWRDDGRGAGGVEAVGLQDEHGASVLLFATERVMQIGVPDFAAKNCFHIGILPFLLDVVGRAYRY
jgi:hypothetical protein